MSFEISTFVQFTKMVNVCRRSELLAINDQSIQYGLTLTEEDAGMLVESEREVLNEYDRIGIGTSAAEQLIRCFMRTAYAGHREYAMLLAELIGVFYRFQAAVKGYLSDDTLAELMFWYFENESGGDLELLECREITHFCECLAEFVADARMDSSIILPEQELYTYICSYFEDADIEEAASDTEYFLRKLHASLRGDFGIDEFDRNEEEEEEYEEEED